MATTYDQKFVSSLNRLADASLAQAIIPRPERHK
jgi:hypothetical protein